MSNSDTSQNFESSSIAVIGMACRFPQAKDLEEFWQNLRDGVESIVSFSEEDLEAAGVFRKWINHPRFVRAGAVIEGEDLFDASFFGYNPREAEALDPQHRLFLECAWEALENAGYDSESYPGSIGVYAGSGVSGYLLRIFSSSKLLRIVGPHQALIANVSDYLATRVSYKVNLKGPSLDVQTACSTSLVAVHLACQSILHGECGMALAGGVTINTPQKSGYLYEEGGINSPDGRCRTFDAAARGTVGGNGLGIVVLKRLDEALADGDNIYAVIRGSAVNNDGSLKVGFTAPSVIGQAEVIAEAQAVAGVEPETISYVEAHGTATPLGDPIEVEALTQAFRAGTDRKNFCAIGSVKTNIGHLDAAAGVAGLIKTALALEHKQIPPSLNFESPNPKIDFENSPFYVNVELREWERNGRPRRAGVSSFGIGGTNAHVVVEEAPEIGRSTASRPAQLLLLSAKTNTALEKATANLLAHLRKRPDVNLADVAFTLQVGRRAFSHRRVIVCSDVGEAVAALETLDPKKVFTLTAGSPKSPIVFMFSGQGAQYVNMGLGLYRAEPEFRRQVDLCAEMLEPHLGLDLRQLLYPHENHSEDAAQRLRQTHVTQPALFVIEYALAKMWMSWGVTPQAMIGHSVGEYVAACLAGVFSLEDALELIVLRGRLMQEMPEGSMLAVPLPAEEVKPLLNGQLSLAAVNAPSLCVVSGPKDAIGALKDSFLASGVECRLLHTSHAFHSAMMEPAVGRFIEEVRKVKLNRPTLPYISNLTGTWVTEEQAIDPVYWGAHLRHPVLFAQGAQELLKQPEVILLEVGPGQTLASLARQQGQASTARSVLASLRRPDERQDDEAFLLGVLGRLWLAGVKVNWKGFYLHEQRRRVALPSYPFERQRFWLEGTGLSITEEGPESPYKKTDIADWFYEPMWKRSGHLTMPEPAELADQNKGYLVFLDDFGLGAAIVERLRDYGQKVVTVSTSGFLEKFADHAYGIAPRQKEDYEGLLRELDASGGVPGVIVNLWSVTSHDVSKQAGAPKGDEELGFYSLLYLTQAVGKMGLTDPLRIIVVSNDAQEVTGEESICPEKALVLGLCRVVPQEYLNITCRSVDVSSSRFGAPWGEALVRALAAEVTVANSDLNVAYRGKRRWVEIFEPLRIDGNYGPHGETARNSLLREGGVYLITGGLGRVGLALASHLARTVKAKLVLLGRTPSPPREEWDQLLAARQEADEAGLRAVLGLEKEGAEVLLVTADVADERQMREALERVYERFGALHGVIHGAAGKTVAAIQETTVAECEAQFRAKVDGLRVLEEVLRGANPDFCLLLSSVASVLGGLGYGAYSAASNFMDAFARRQSLVSSFPWISVNMDGWRFGDEREQGATAGAAVAELAMTQAEGVEAIQRVLRLGARPQIVISTGDLHARIAQWVKLESIRKAERSATDEAISFHQRPELATAFVAPADETERAVSDIWRRLLGIERIGVQDNFFELGGHSLLATQIISQIRKVFQAEIPLRSMLETPTIAGLAQCLKETIATNGDARPLAIAPVPRDRRLPLSFAQQRLWFLHRMEPDNPFYNLSTAFRLIGDLNVRAVERSLNEVVRRHEALRTTVAEAAEANGQPVQVIAPELVLALPVKDLTELAEAELEKEVRRLAEEEARRPFDLSRGPLLRAALLRVAENEHVMLFTMHHIVSDGWSMALLVQEVTALYQAFSQGKPSPLAELNVQYADFAVWQREWMQGEVLKEQLAYWRDKLGGDLPALELPIDRPRPATQSYRGEIEYLSLSKETAVALGALSRREGVTPFMFLLAAFKALLHRYTGQSDILVGTPSANRNRAETEALIGFFINTLVLRTQVTGELSFLDLLNQARDVTLGAYAHQDLPFDTLVMELQPDRNLSHMPLFQVAFNIYNFPTPALELPDIKLIPVNSDSGAMPYDLILTARDGEDGMLLGLGYNTDIFDGSTVERMLLHFRALLEAVIADPSQRLRDVPLLGDDERRGMLVAWNDTYAGFSGPRVLHQIFEAQVDRMPDKIAVQFDDHQVTYAELDAQANSVARRLRALGVGPETRVGVCLGRSVDLVVALLGVLKAGGGYVPLDPTYPQERLAFIIEDSRPPVLLVQRGLAASLPASQAHVIYFDGRRAERGERFDCGVSPENLAYVIYTSGSTGAPKGVMISHGSIRNRLLWALHACPLTPDDILLQKTVFTFDASVWEIFAPLFAGARLALARPDGHRDSAYLVEAIRSERVTILQMAPSMLRVFLREEGIERCESLRHVFCGGEELKAEDRELFFARSKARLHNLYGPTEVSIDATHWECERNEEAGMTPPIGRPLSNVQTYILDNYLQPVSIGAPGELHVGGAGLARGYLNRPDLTAEKFIPNPFSSSPGAELYKTGDLARYLPDGRIGYLGRIDHQVKLRGYRIELSEVEAVICQHPSVSQAAVVVREDGPGQRRLVAYVVEEGRRATGGLANGTKWYRLPNQVEIAHLNKSETDLLYREVFEDECYLRNDIRLDEGACVFDVGANIGLFTLFVHDRCPGARVYAFEPIPVTYQALAQNVMRYGKGSKAYQCGLSDRPGSARFTFYRNASATSGMYADLKEEMRVTRAYVENQKEVGRYADELMEGRFESETFECPLRTVSDVMREEGVERIDLLKVDVEKSELDVLRGVGDEDWGKIKQVALEAHDRDGNLTEITALLERHGFHVVVEQDDSLKNTGLYNVYAVHPSRGGERSEVTRNDRHNGALAGLVPPALTENELRRYLEAKLPEYMAPSAIVFLNELPTTPGGKLNRRALPPPDHLEDGDADSFDLPQTSTEELVAGIWAAVLGLGRVGRKSNFFDLGGHSLMAMQVMSRVRKMFKADLRVRVLFERPTLEGLSAAIDEAVSGGDSVARRAEAGGQSPLSFAQRRIWLQDQLDNGNSAHNLPVAVRMRGPLDVPALEQSIDGVIKRQWALRTTFVKAGERPGQIINSARPLELRSVDLSGPAEAEREARARQLAEEEWRRPFDLANDLLLRPLLIKLSEQEHLLLLTTHRIVADEWSGDILVNEIAASYEGRSKGYGSAPRLTELPVQYADFVAWQNERMQGGALAEQLAYWRQRLDGAPALALPADRVRPVDATSSRSSHTLALPADLTESLRALSRQEKVTMFMVSLATFQALLSYCTGQLDIVVGADVPNRGRVETRGLCGPLANQLAIRTDLSGDPPFRDLLDRVREVVLGAYANQDLPFEKLIEELNHERDENRGPLIRAKLVHLNLAPRTIKAAGLRFEPLSPSFGKVDDAAHLLLRIAESEGGLLCELFYSADLFSFGAVERLLGHFHALLCQVVAQPESRLSELTAVLAESDKQRRLEEEQALEHVSLKTLKLARRKPVGKLKATGD